MQNIQEVFDRIQENKKQQKEIKNTYQDALVTSPEYQEIKDKIKTLQEKKKSIEGVIREQFANEFTKLDDLKIDLESDVELLSDITISKMMKGEPIEIKDAGGNEYEPRFKVNFKKIS